MKIILLLFILLAGCGAPPSHEFDDIEAAEAARRWLTQIDRGMAEKAWSESSPLFQKTAPEGARLLAQSRDKTGLPRSRVEKQKRRVESLPGLPPGIYVVVEYDTQFTRGTYAETAILSQEGDWKIVGYFMRKAIDPRPQMP